MKPDNNINLSNAAMQIAAKSDKENRDQWLPLWMHLYDTAIVMEYLQNNWISSIYEGYGISPEAIKRVGIFLAAIHDLGKATPSFQSMILGKIEGYSDMLMKYNLSVSKGFTENERLKYGHHSECGALLLYDYGVCREVAVVAAAHHGNIPPKGYTDEDSSSLAQHPNLFWDEKQKKVWQSVQEEYIKFALDLAGFQSTDEIPQIEKELQMLISGLLITADWIASNKQYFPLVMNRAENEGLIQLYPMRGKEGISKLEFPQCWKTEERLPNTDLIRMIFGFSSNEMQKKVQELAGTMQNPGLIIIEAPMGNGKTEASLAAAEILAQKAGKSGLAFFLPSQATTNALFTRLESWALKQTNGNKLAIQLAHGSFLLNREFEVLQNMNSEEEGEPELVTHQFFCGSKSFLLANFVAGTIDQMLTMAVQQKHVMLKQLGLADKVIVIDECHAYDAYMNVYLDRALKYLQQYRVPVIILSATLPAKRRMELLNTYVADEVKKDTAHPLSQERSYPLISWTDGTKIGYTAVALDKNAGKKVYLERLEEAEVISGIQKMYECGACVGVIVNTVAKAQNLAQQMEEFAGDRMILYHAQYLLSDRIVKESEIIHYVGKSSLPKDRKGRIIIGTQVLEQSLDIDFDVLITELCPMDLLLQRIGRLHRHWDRARPKGFEAAGCFVLGADAEELDAGSKSIYGAYLLKNTIRYLPKEITLPTDISELVQATYDEENVDDALAEEYGEFCRLREGQKSRAAGFLLPQMLHGRRAGKTIEGLSGNGVTEDTARISVRDGDPSMEVVVIRDEGNQMFSLLSGENRGQSYSMTVTPDQRTAKEIASQKLRLPHKLCNKWNGPRVAECLRQESDTRLEALQRSPWLHNEWFLILDEKSEKCLLERYQLHYSYKYGLVITEGE